MRNILLPILILTNCFHTTALAVEPPAGKPDGRAAGLRNMVEVNGLGISLDQPAKFHADDPLVFTLKLRNISDRELSFPVYGGINGTSVGDMEWKITDVKNATIWKAVANPNPGPMPGMPQSMQIKKLKPGESFDAHVRVLLWGQMFGMEKDPVRTTFALPAGKYSASVGVNINSIGHATLESPEFEISSEKRPVPVKVRQTREQITTKARETLTGCWKRLQEAKVSPVQELDAGEIQAAEIKIEESAGQGMEQGRTIYSVTFLAPCRKLGGTVRFHWSFDDFGKERSMSGPQLIKE